MQWAGRREYLRDEDEAFVLSTSSIELGFPRPPLAHFPVDALSSAASKHDEDPFLPYTDCYPRSRRGGVRIRRARSQPQDR